MALGNGELRLEVRSELAAVRKQGPTSVAGTLAQVVDVARELDDTESLILVCQHQSNGDTLGLVTIVTPTWTTAGLERRVALQRQNQRVEQHRE